MRVLALIVIIYYFHCGYCSDGPSAQHPPRGQSEKSSLIIGGHPADFNHYSFTLRVKIYESHEPPIRIRRCTGVGLSKIIALTAATCVDLNPPRVTVVVGISNTSEPYPPGVETEFEAEDIKKHPEYNRHTKRYNIAIITTYIDDTELHYEPAVLPDEDRVPPHSPQNVIIVGWGTATGDPNDLSVTLNAVTVQVFDHGKCNVRFHNVHPITSEMFCAGVGIYPPHKNACAGDTGGPVVDSQGEVVGIVSIIQPNCRTAFLPSVHTSISRVRHWINKMTGI